MKGSQDRRNLDHWSLDKRVPITMVLTIVLQTGLAIWWAASISERVQAIERSQNYNATIMERMVRVEIFSEQNKTTLDRIEGKMEKVRR